MGWSVAYSPDGHTLLSGGSENVRGWALAPGQQCLGWEGTGVHTLTFLPEGAVAVHGGFGTVEVRRFPDGELLERHVPSEGGPVQGKPEENVPTEPRAMHTYHVAYHHALRVAAGSYCIGMSLPNYVLLWRVGPTPTRRYLWSHQEMIPAVELSPSGRLVASGSWDKTVVGDTATGERVATWGADT